MKVISRRMVARKKSSAKSNGKEDARSRESSPPMEKGMDTGAPPTPEIPQAKSAEPSESEVSRELTTVFHIHAHPWRIAVPSTRTVSFYFARLMGSIP